MGDEGAGPTVTRHEEITAIRDRIAKAETDREICRVAGLKDKYVEAYFKVEALERQLDLRLGESG